MKISIITVVYNNAATIEDTILSVATQSHLNIEHIVVDGGSTDGTLSIIERHRDKLSIVVSEPDNGIYDAMNKGLQLASGEVIGLLNADDIYAGNDVLGQVAQAFSDISVDACYANLVYVDRNDLKRVVRYWQSCDFRDGLFEKGWMPAHPTFFVRRDIYERFGGFDLEFRLQADFELTMRLLAIHHIKSIYIPRIFVQMRTGGVGSRPVNILKGNFEAWRACRKNGLKVSPFFMLTKIMSRIPQFFSRLE